MRPFLLATFAVALLQVHARAFADDPVVLAERNAPPAVEVHHGGATARQAADRLAAYLEAVTGSGRREESDRTIICGDASIATKFGIPAPDPSRDESFSVAPVTRDGKLRLIISGQTDLGIKRGVYNVLKNLCVASDGRVLLAHATARESPAIKMRVSHIGGYTRQAFDPQNGKKLAKEIPATPEQFAWNYITYWDPPRIGDYIDLLDFLGYNGIEEPPMLYAPAENGDGVAVARRKIVFDRVRANGMVAIAKIDGTVFREGAALPYGADTKAEYDQYYRQMAESAAPYNDFLLTHWVDAGGWKGDVNHPCTIALLQDLHVRADREFKRVNPKITSFLSLWFLDNPGYQRWLGYEGVGTMLESGKLSDDVGLAMSRTYRPNEAAKITAAGRRAAVWGWYTADNELLYTMHVHTHMLGDYFHNLPSDAGEKLFFHSLDNCQRETNLYTVYVGAQMMWNPKGEPEVYLREIARLVYGPKLEEPVFRALKAIADVRCGKKCQGCWSPAVNGVVALDEGLKQAADAYAAVKDVEIDRTYIPPIRFHRPPEVLLSEVKAHTQVLAAYMRFVKDKQDGNPHPTEVPKSAGPFESYERIRYLQNR